MNEMTIEELADELRHGARAILQVRHGERPKMDPKDPTFGDALALTDEGARTARILGEKLRDFRDETTFCASPLRRTVMTAELIAEGMGVARPDIPTAAVLGNDSFYYADAAAVLDVFRPENFFNACFEYFRAGEQRGFHNLHEATDALEAWLAARHAKRLLVAATHDCFIAAFLAARGAVEEFTRDNWLRFLDGGVILYRPDGTKTYALVRAGLSTGICGVGGKVM